MNIKPIRTEKDYQEALHEIDQLIDAPDGTPEADKLEVLSTLVADYEDKHYPIDPPDPIEAIKFRMEQEGLSTQDLVAIIGSRSRVSEILNRKRRLTLPMIRSLSSELHISPTILVSDYRVMKKPRKVASHRLKKARKAIMSRKRRESKAKLCHGEN